MFRILQSLPSESRGRSTAPHPPSYRPQLEVLEDRCVPNASRVFDALGHQTMFAVRYDGALIRYDSLSPYDLGVATVYFAGRSSGPQVRWVQAYLDPAQNLGVNVIFETGSQRWVVYDSTGSHAMLTYLGDVQSVSTAFDPAGQEVLDIVTNSWYRYDAAGFHTMFAAGPNSPNSSQEAETASTAIDPAGHQVSDYTFGGHFDCCTFQVETTFGVWGEINPSGRFTKGGGGHTRQIFPNGDLQTVSNESVGWVMPSFDATGALAYDIGNGGWVYYDAQGAHVMAVNVR